MRGANAGDVVTLSLPDGSQVVTTINPDNKTFSIAVRGRALGTAGTQKIHALVIVTDTSGNPITVEVEHIFTIMGNGAPVAQDDSAGGPKARPSPAAPPATPSPTAA